MRPAHRPSNEAHRLEVLRRYNLLDSMPEQGFDDIARLAAHICGAPIAHISLVDEHRQWFKSEIGTALVETSRDVSFCGHTILGSGLMIVPDASVDERFADNPMVIGNPEIRFYAGAPMITSDGVALGALCVLDHVPRELTPQQQEALAVLSRQVLAQMELRRQTRELIATEAAASLAAAMSARAEREFRSLFAANPLAMWIYDKETLRFLEVNDAAVAQYGYSHAEFLSMTIKDIRPDEDVGRLLSAIAAGRSDWLNAGAWRHRVKSGRVIDVDITSHVLDFAGRAAVLVVAQDLTEQRAAQEARRESDERYRRLFEAAPDGLLIADQQGVYIECNPSACRLLGYTRDELIGMNGEQILAHADAPQAASVLETLRTKSEFYQELRFRRKDGSTFTADSSGTALPDGTFLGIVRDVTERNEALEALSEAEERMRYALQCANIGIWDRSYVTGVTKWSREQEANYGLAHGEYDGTSEKFMSLVHPDDRAPARDLVEAAIRAGSDFSILHRAVWPDGTVRWISGIGRVDVDAQGHPVRGIGISIDVTEKRQLEEQYQQAQKMEAVGRLAGGIAHDFNNLLTAILGYCELLLADSSRNDGSREDLEEIRKAGMRAAGLTRQLLAFSRREIIAPTLLDLNEVVTDMRSMLQRLIGEDIRVNLELGPGALRMKADRSQLEQIVMNLAVNARDALPKGGEIVLKTYASLLDANFHDANFKTDPQPFVALSVCDNGVGMTPEVQARAFEPFFTTKDVGKGTGLGLATVHGIVKRAGGAVTVQSELGQGTSVNVFFPTAPDDEVAPIEIHPQPRVHGGAETVLVVEDEDGLRELTRRLLLRQGYEVHVAANADEAIRIFGTISADILLTDVVMPGSSGPELMERLVAKHPGLKVVYMSGYTEDTIVHHGVLEPGIALVHKPFTSEALSQKLREVLDR